LRRASGIAFGTIRGAGGLWIAFSIPTARSPDEPNRGSLDAIYVWWHTIDLDHYR